jgi:phage gp46-like protein
MADIRTASVATLEAVTLDWLLAPSGALDDTEELATAVRIALGTDALADPDEELPGFDDDRKGWWADLDAGQIWDGWPIGSKIWLYRRSKIVGQTLAKLEGAIRDALQPMIDRAIFSRVDVSLERDTADANRVAGTVIIYRGPRPVIALRYASLWAEVEG